MHKVLMGAALVAAATGINVVASQGAAVAQAPKQADSGSTATCDQPGDPLVSFAALSLAKPGTGGGSCTGALGSSY